MIFGDQDYISGLNWAMTIAYLAERVHAGELLEALQRAELDTGAASATIHEVAQKRVDALKLYLAATAVWHEEARRYVQVISSTESAAARAREAVRTEAQQEHAVAGPGSRNAELN